MFDRKLFTDSLPIANERSVRMRWLILWVLLLSTFGLGSTLRAQNLETHNNFVWATVEDATGLISIYQYPGPPNGNILSFQNHSYLSVQIGSVVYTNNPPANTSKPDFLGSGGVLTKVGDTIYCTWANIKNTGVDVIQKVYPVAFTKSGQIVISISFTNHTNIPVACAAQYLLDTEIADLVNHTANDRSKILTRYQYTNTWQQYTVGNPGIPWFYMAFAYDLPNSPKFTTTPNGQGYCDYPPLGLIIPNRVTVGDWTQLSLLQWGPYSGSGLYGDSGVLMEWPAVGVPMGKTVEVARTSYGTGEFETCLGGLLGLFFYPHVLPYDAKLKQYVPNPFLVDAYLVNTDLNSSATAAWLQLDVGPMLTIISPAGNITNNGQTEKLFTSASLSPGAVSELSWMVQARLNKNCSTDSFSFLKFTSNSSVSPANFANPNPCTMPIRLPCTVSDTLPPIVDSRIDYHSPTDTMQANVHDDRSTDDGMKSITFQYVGTDQTQFIVAINPTVVGGQCDHFVHGVRVIQKDSTVGGCFYFAFTDCNNNVSYDTMCFQVHPLITHPDVRPPVIKLSGLFDVGAGGACSAHCDSMVASDIAQYDVGIKSVTVTPSTTPTNMGLTVNTFVVPSPIVPFVVCVNDSMKPGSISVRVTDAANNSTDTVITYCATVDTNRPVVTVSPLNKALGQWTIRVTELKPWDSGIDSVILTNAQNVTFSTPDPRVNANTLGQTDLTFTVTIQDTFKFASFCVYATDRVHNLSPQDCEHDPPTPDSWNPNITLQPKPNTDPNRVTVSIDDIHFDGKGDTINWDSGIDSIWISNVTGITVPPNFPLKLACVKSAPSFVLAVTDTLNTDSLACATINAMDCAGNRSQFTWCYPFTADNAPPKLASTITKRLHLLFHATDSLPYDRGLKQATIGNNTNFTPLAQSALNDAAAADLAIDVSTPGVSAVGTLTVEDTWGALAQSPATKLAHSASVEVHSWAQNVAMKRAYLFLADSVPASGVITVPVNFVKSTLDTISLYRKGISEYSFNFSLTGDVGSISFTGADVTNTATTGWTVTSTKNGNAVTIKAMHGSAGILTDTSKPLLKLTFLSVKDPSTRSIVVSIDTFPTGESIIYNGNRDTAYNGFNATAMLPAPYGSMSGAHIVIAGTCAPALDSGAAPKAASIEPNHPNPFATRTTFHYTVPQTGLVTLVIFDAMGREVSRLVSSEMAAGRYEATFDAVGVAPGTYFARFETAGKVISRSIVISR